MTNPKKKTPLRVRLRAATDPTPSWSLTDPATLASLATTITTILTVFLNVGHADRYVKLGLLIATGIVVPLVSFAKHKLALGGLLADVAEALSEIGQAMNPQPVVLPPGSVGEVDHSGMKLGKLAVKRDDRTFRLAAYATAKRWRSPVKIDWSTKVPGWPMMGNDRYGDCVFATIGHLIEEWTAQANPPSIVLSDEQILAAYGAVTGFDPRTGANDNGANELDALNWWRQTGIVGHKIRAYVALDVKRKDEVRYAVAEFGGAFTGINLPISAQRQAVWDVVPGGGADTAPGSWGGHAVPYVAYNAVGPVCVTWGQLKQITWAFHFAYCEEAYAVLSPDWFPKGSGRSPGGFDEVRLERDLAAL